MWRIAMSRKRRLTRLSSYTIPVINPQDRHAVDVHDLVRHALVDFEELTLLPAEKREQLVADLVRAIYLARGGLRVGKRGVSDKASVRQVFLADIKRALESAGLSATRWRKQYDNGGGESLYFRLVREVGEVAGIPLPKDLKLMGRLAAKVQYGTMSPQWRQRRRPSWPATRRRPCWLSTYT